MGCLVQCNCGEFIVKENGGETKIRGKLIVMKSNKAFSVCGGCGAEVEVPLELDQTLIKSLRTNPPLYIGKKR